MTASITTTEELTCPLNPEEVADRAIELGVVYDQCLQLETAKAQAGQKLAAQIKEKKKRAAELAAAVASKSEKRPVAITEQADYRRMAMDRIRHDTLEVIGSRPMTADELEEARQGHLFDSVPVKGADGNGKAKGKRGKPAAEASAEASAGDAPPAGESTPAPAASGEVPTAGESEPGAPGTEITPDPALLAAADAAAGELGSGHPTVRRGRRGGKGLSLVKGAEDGTQHDA